MAAHQTASKANKEAARKTNTRARKERLTRDAVTGNASRGDYSNRSEMRNDNKSLTGQNFGTHNDRYADLVAAFGRARKDQVDADGNLITGPGGTATLSFSVG